MPVCLRRGCGCPVGGAVPGRGAFPPAFGRGCPTGPRTLRGPGLERRSGSAPGPAYARRRRYGGLATSPAAVGLPCHRGRGLGHGPAGSCRISGVSGLRPRKGARGVRQADRGRLVAGRYRLLERIGRGGMGTVWRAEDELLGRQVAVKKLHPPQPHLYDDELGTLFERTRREARSAARISHPNVVVVHDVVDDEGLPSIVMEYVPSTTLGDLLKKRRTAAARGGRPDRPGHGRRAAGRARAPGCCTATSSPATCCSARTAGSCSPTSASPRRPAPRP